MSRGGTVGWMCIAAWVSACRVGYDPAGALESGDVVAESADASGDSVLFDTGDGGVTLLDVTREVTLDETDDRTPDATMETGVDARVDTGTEAAVDVQEIATDGSTAMCGDGSCRRVFVTSATVPSGAIGGLTAADALCQSTATAQTLGGTWMAFMSDGTTSAVTRLSHATVPYELLDGTVVAANWTALTAGHIAHAIDMYETGVSRGTADSVGVWTGSNSTGTIQGASCTNWTDGTSGTQGGSGDDTSAVAAWTNRGSNACNVANRIYCIEQ